MSESDYESNDEYASAACEQYDVQTSMLKRTHAIKVAELKAQAPEDLDVKLQALEAQFFDSMEDLAQQLLFVYK